MGTLFAAGEDAESHGRRGHGSAAPENGQHSNTQRRSDSPTPGSDPGELKTQPDMHLSADIHDSVRDSVAPERKPHDLQQPRVVCLDCGTDSPPAPPRAGSTENA